MSNDRPVFVVGCARSGTTLLQLMLHAHPRLAMPPENRFVLPVYRRRVRFGDLTDPAKREEVAEFIVGQRKTKFADLDIDADRVRDRLRAAPPTIGSLLGEVLAEYAEAHGKARWGDKRPNYIQHLDTLVALFPDVQIVHVIRDGRACVASLKRMPWWTYGYAASVYKWRAAIRIGDDARSRLPADSYTEVRYEDLVSRPRPTLESLCAFLGEDFHERMLTPNEVAAEEVPGYKGWHAETHQPVSDAQVHKWQGELDHDEVALIELVAGRQLRQWGYELTLPPHRRIPSASMLRDWAGFLVYRKRKERHRATVDDDRAEDYPYPLAARLTSRQRALAGATEGTSTRPRT